MDQKDIDKANQEKLRRAELARQVLENPIYREALMMIRAEIVGKMSKTDPKKIDELQDITRTLQNLDRVEKILESTYKSGKAVITKQNKPLNFLKRA